MWFNCKFNFTGSTLIWETIMRKRRNRKPTSILITHTQGPDSIHLIDNVSNLKDFDHGINLIIGHERRKQLTSGRFRLSFIYGICDESVHDQLKDKIPGYVKKLVRAIDKYNLYFIRLCDMPEGFDPNNEKHAFDLFHYMEKLAKEQDPEHYIDNTKRLLQARGEL